MAPYGKGSHACYRKSGMSDSTEVAAPGLIRGLPAADYHAIKALSAGMVWTADSECPRKAWIGSPWNAARESTNAHHFDIGTAAHLAILEPGIAASRTVIVRGFTAKGVPSAGYASHDAKEQRDAAYAAGKTPLLIEEWNVVEEMRAAVMGAHPLTPALFAQGDTEVTVQWEWNGLACKCRPDLLASDLSYVLDLKTTPSANPRTIAVKAAREGWHVRASWYLGGIKAATGTLPDRYLFVVAESKPPHLIEVYELDLKALIYGDQIIGRTIKVIGECLSKNDWPGYGDGKISTIALPSWVEFQRAEREEAGEFC